jgi:hypothetical protein
LIFAQTKLSEAEQLEKDATRDVAWMKLLNARRQTKSPRLLLEILLIRTNDPVGFLDGRFEKRLERLKELGALQDRQFQILDTNGQPARVNVMKMFEKDDVLWRVTGPRTNGIFEVRARPSAMRAWEKLAREYAERKETNRPAQ